jgi:hypothetical protein
MDNGFNFKSNWNLHNLSIALNNKIEDNCKIKSEIWKSKRMNKFVN